MGRRNKWTWLSLFSHSFPSSSASYSFFPEVTEIRSGGTRSNSNVLFEQLKIYTHLK